MLKITDAVKELVYDDEVALFCVAQGLFNLSAYAENIRKQVQAKTKKPVRLGSIVAALARLSPSLKRQKLFPEVVLTNIAAQTGLIEISYDKNSNFREKLQKVYQHPELKNSEFLTVTHGVTEISIILPAKLKTAVLQQFLPLKPKLVIENLSSLTVSFPPEYISVPNTTYVILRALAVKRINIAEMVSTFTEITFFLAQKDLQIAFELLNRRFFKSL